MTTTTAIEAQGRNWRPVDTLGIRVKLTRMSLGLSQQEAADAIGITAREWQSLEEGRAARRLDVKIKRIANAWGVDRARW